jgi:hypothetical protein
VKRARDQFLAGAGLSLDENCGSGRSDGLDFFQNLQQGGALPNDLPEIVLGAHFLFQIDFFLGQLVFQFGKLPIGLRVFYGNGNLLGNLAQ